MIMLQLTKSNKKTVAQTFTQSMVGCLGYLRSEDGIAWLWYFSENLHMYSSPFYLALKEIVAWTFGVIVTGLLLNRGWMLKTFHGSSYFCSEYETVYFYYGTVTISYLKMNKNKASFSEMILPPSNLDLLLRKFKSFI